MKNNKLVYNEKDYLTPTFILPLKGEDMRLPIVYFLHEGEKMTEEYQL